MRQSEVLEKFSQLTGTQKELIRREVEDFLALNKDLAEEKPTVCPKCGKAHKIISHGHQKGNGKHRYKCTACGRVIKFIYRNENRRYKYMRYTKTYIIYFTCRKSLPSGSKMALNGV